MASAADTSTAAVFDPRLALMIGAAVVGSLSFVGHRERELIYEDGGNETGFLAQTISENTFSPKFAGVEGAITSVPFIGSRALGTSTRPSAPALAGPVRQRIIPAATNPTGLPSAPSSGPEASPVVSPLAGGASQPSIVPLGQTGGDPEIQTTNGVSTSPFTNGGLATPGGGPGSIGGGSINTPATFAAPVVNNPIATIAPVPEPMLWITMILGFGMVGSAMRFARRRDVANPAV